MKKFTTLRFAGIFATSLVASLFSLSTVDAQTPTVDAASTEAPQVASEPKYPEFYNDEKYAIYRDPRYAKPLPEGIFGMRTITVPEDGFHNDQDRELYAGLKGVADVLAQERDYDGLLQKLEPYSEAIFGKETTDNYGGVLYKHFIGVYYQDYKRALTLLYGHPTLCASLTICHVDGYIVFRVNKDPLIKTKAEEIELNGNWQTGEIVKVSVFYFDSRDAFEITFYPDGSPRRFRRCEFADAPTNFLGVPFRPGPNGKSRAKRFDEAMKSQFPTLVLYSTVWNQDGSVAERVDEPTDVAETIGTASLKASNFLKKDEESVSNEAASEKTE